jgi:PKD repeat protein
MDREEAVSKIFIVVIIALAVIIGVVLVYLFVLSPGQNVVPRFNATVEFSGKTVYIYHDGGDPVAKGSVIIRINGEQVPAQAITFLHAQDWPWSVGKTLKIEYPGTGIPASVQIIHTGGSSPTLVFSRQLEQPVTPVPATPAVTAPIVPVPETLAVLTPAVTPVVTMIPASPPVIIPEVTISPARPEPPGAAFTASPVQGEAPLEVQFTDRSTGNPESWFWTFGDGASSTIQNPVHGYTTAGTYTVDLTVSSRYGTQKTSRVGYIHVGSVPTAQFTAEPRQGTAPLEVKFTDLSTGDPASWQWNLGDGSTSQLRNPTHIYAVPGTYSVALTSTNDFGANTRIQSDYITVQSAPLVDIYLTNSREGNILPNGYMQFFVTSGGSWVKIGGKQYPFTPGDVVQLFPDPAGQAEIDASDNRFSALRFDFIRMYINGEKVAEGIVTDISVTRFDGFKSTLILDIPAGDTGGTLQIDGKPVIKGDHQFTAFNLKPDSSGTMYYTRTFENLRYNGGAEGFAFT